MKIKRLVAASVLSIGISFAGVSAGIPVIDVSSIAEAVKTFQELQRQQTILTNQLNQLERNIESMTGSRGLANIINSTYDGDVLNGIDVERVLRENDINPASDLGLNGEAAKLFDLSNTNAAIQADTSAKSLAQSQRRFDDLTGLIAKVNDSADPKDIMDLHARIAAEQTFLQNETIKLQALEQQSYANQLLYDQQVRQMQIEAVGELPTFKPR